MVYRFLLLFYVALLLPLISYSSQEYVVKKGDNLYDIAKKFDVSVDELKKENNLKNARLDIGDELIIPSSEDAASQDKSNNIYVVKSGDTLSQIAEKNGVKTKDLKEQNNLQNSNIKIGQELKIPSSEEAVEVVVSSEKTLPTWDTEITVRPNDAPAPKETQKTAQVKTLPPTYTVKKGDVPGKIAEELGVSTKELIELNGLNSKSIQIGQVLKVPGAEPVEKTADAAPKKEAAQEKAAVKPEKEKKAEQVGKPSAQATYVVKKGDTPGEIAEKLGVKTKDLISLNNLNSKSLQIGQELKVPGAGTETTAKKAEAKSSGIPNEYTVKKGDSLYVISKRYKISINEIKQKNNLRGDTLRVGQKIVLGAQAIEPTQVASEKPAENLETPRPTGKYTVKKGDTIGGVALKFGVSQKELKRENGLRTNNIRIGQVLRVPGDSVKAASEPVKKEKKAAYVKKRYVVKSGDTLSGIADNFDVSVKELKKASALKNDRINKGDVLLIPVPHDYVASSPAKPVTASGPQYTVVTGDTLGGIASKHGVTVSQLKSANGLTNNELWVGMELDIPGGKTAVKSAAPKTTKLVRKTYTVKRGDTLGVIAQRYGVTVSGLKQENGLRSSSIRVGQTLKIPGTSKYTHTYSASANGHNNGYSSEIKKSPKYNIIKVAKKYLGAPYKFGGNSYKTGIDCSGYVKKVFSSFNVELPRTARDIYYRSGYKVPKSELDTGDLVFFQTYAKFPSHVGIYIGDDQFIHASSSRKRVTIDDLNKRYYRNRYIGAKRIQVSSLFYDEYSKNIEGK